MGKKKRDFSFTDKHVEFFEIGSAEYEKELPSVYISNEYLKSALDFSSKRTFYIARTGVGKTAILSKIRSDNAQDKVISIDPEQFAPIILEKSQILKTLTAYNVNTELFLKTVWRFIIITEILRRRFGANKKNWFQKFNESDSVAKRAYKFLDSHNVLGEDTSFADKMKRIIESLNAKVKVEFEALGFSFAVEPSSPQTSETEALQKIINEFEFHEVTYFLKELDACLNGYKYFILIDDLDKTWIESTIGISFMKSLFNAIVDFANMDSIKVVVSLRMNLFTQISFPQPERFKSFITRIQWTDNDLKAMVESRFNYLFKIDKNSLWDNVLPSEMKFENYSLKIHKYLMRMSNRRPRDLFLLIAAAMKHSIGKNRISQESFRKAESEFSQDRLKNFLAEWHSPFSDLDALLKYFSGASAVLSGYHLKAIIENMILEIHSSRETKPNMFLWAEKGSYINLNYENFHDPNGLFRLLYRLGVVGVKDSATHKVRFSYDFEDIQFDLALNDEMTVFLNPALVKAITANYAVSSPDFEI